MKLRPSLRRYATPLGTLPLFARAGAIVPMWPPGADVASVRSDFNGGGANGSATMLVELWPHGESAFDLYEDDGVTRAALSSATDGPDGAFVVTTLSSSAPRGWLRAAPSAGANATVRVARTAGGGFAGYPKTRRWTLHVRSRAAPARVARGDDDEARRAPRSRPCRARPRSRPPTTRPAARAKSAATGTTRTCSRASSPCACHRSIRRGARLS